jgi:hypothetical protein
MVTCSVNSETKRRSYAVVCVAYVTWLVKDPQLSSQEYLKQAGTRDNLHVVVCSPVTRILFEDEKSAAGDVVASTTPKAQTTDEMGKFRTCRGYTISTT